jgi:lipopolysaccharide export LptBFGC system permease protein LptF
MSKILLRYLAAQFILPLVLSVTFFVSFLLTFELFRLTSLLVSRDVSVIFMLRLIGDLAVTMIPMALPISIFFSLIYCLGKLCQDSEYIAIRAAGYSKQQILKPFLIIGLIMSVTYYFVVQEIVPYASKDVKARVQFLTSAGMLSALKSGQFLTAIKNLTMFATDAGVKGKGMKEVFIQYKEDKTKDKKLIFANEGDLIFKRDNQTLIETLTLVLRQGNIITVDDVGNVEKILFKEYLLPLKQKNFSQKIGVKETMMNSAQLAEARALSPSEAKKRYNFDSKEIANTNFEYWNRKNGPILIVLMTFLGFCLGIKGNRGKNSNSVLIGIGALVLFYSIYFALIGMAKKNVMPMPVAMLVPDLILFLIALKFYRKLDWQS